MSTGTFVAGKVCPVSWTPAGGSLAALQVTGHSWQEMIDKIDITHTGSAGVQALMATILRGQGNVKAFLDVASNKAYWLAAIGVRAGTSGVLLHYVTASLYHSVPGLITKVNNSVEVANGVQYDFDVELNSEAGAYAYPS